MDDAWVWGSAWLATALFCGALPLRVRQPRSRLSLSLWSLAAAALVAHMLIAMGVTHHWSVSHALDHVATRTADATGWKWSGGFYINCAVGVAWGLDLIWLLKSRPAITRVWTVVWLAWLWSMFLFGAVVFAQSVARWPALVILVVAGMASLPWRRR